MGKIRFIDRYPEKGFMVEERSGTVIYFQYNPSNIVDTRNPSYASIQVPGMSHPKNHFSNGGERTISFTMYLRYGSKMKSRDPEWGSGVTYVKYVTNWLRGLTYPTHNNKGFLEQGPSTVLLNMGRLYPNVPCVVTSLNISYTDWFDPEQLVPLEANVDITLTEDIEKSIPRSVVLTGVR